MRPGNRVSGQSQGRTSGNFGSRLRAVAFDSQAVVLLHCHVAAIGFTAAVAVAVAVAAGKHATFCGQAHDTYSPGAAFLVACLPAVGPTGRMGYPLWPHSDKSPTEISAGHSADFSTNCKFP